MSEKVGFESIYMSLGGGGTWKVDFNQKSNHFLQMLYNFFSATMQKSALEIEEQSGFR